MLIFQNATFHYLLKTNYSILLYFLQDANINNILGNYEFLTFAFRSFYLGKIFVVVKAYWKISVASEIYFMYILSIFIKWILGIKEARSVAQVVRCQKLSIYPARLSIEKGLARIGSAHRLDN